MNNDVANGRYVVVISSFRKITSKKGEKIFKVDFKGILDENNKPCAADIVDFIKISDYSRLAELKKSFLYLDYDSIDNIVGCQGIIRVNKGYINYYDLKDIILEENIKL